MSDRYYLRVGNRNTPARKYPVQLSEKYTVEIIDLNGQTVRMQEIEVTGLQKEVIVRAGRFTCYEETYKDDLFTYHTYLAVGCGQIDQLVYNNRNILVARTQLVSYTIQK